MSVPEGFKVSVVIPVYNAGQYVEESVTSALRLPEVSEIILVEDGSKDDSLAKCESLAAKDKRIRLFRHAGGVNRGAAESRNLGMSNANAPFIAFLDSDDVYYENRFARPRQIFANDPTVDAVYDDVLIRNDATGKTKIFGIRKNTDAKALFRQILRGGYFHTNSITIRREFLNQLSPHFIQYCWPHEDVELWLRMAYYGKVISGGTSGPVATYRIHSANNIVSQGSLVSRSRLWETVWNHFFYRAGLIDKMIILKQRLRFKVKLWQNRQDKK